MTEIPLLLISQQEADEHQLKALLTQLDSSYQLKRLTPSNLTAAQLADYEIYVVASQRLVAAIAPKVAPAPVIFLTDNTELGTAALEAGAADYLERSQLSAPLLEKSLRLTLACAQAKRWQQELLKKQRLAKLDECAGVQSFEPYIESAKQQLQTFQQSVASSSLSEKFLAEVFEQLTDCLEELQVQNEELLATHWLVQENQRYQDLFEFAPDGYLVTDRKGIIQEANSAAATLLNMRQQFLIGKPLLVYIASAARQTYERRLMQTQQFQEWDLCLQPREGQPFPASVRISAIFNAQNELVGWRWLIRDITERKQAEAALQQQTEILQTIFDHIPVMIARFDASGRIELINRELERTLGWSLAEWQQQDLLAECYPDPEYRQQVGKHMQEATHQWQDLKTRVRDGRVIDTSWRNVRLSDGTGIGIGQDISKRKRDEEQLRARLALETALAETSKLLATREVVDLNEVLALLADAVEANRVFLLRLHQGTKADVAHEWCDSESQSIAERFQNLEMTQFRWWLDQLERNQNVAIADVEAMPAAAQVEKEILKSIKVCALIAAPIFDTSGQLWGSIGFHLTRQGGRQWSAEDAQLLRAVGDTIYSYCLRVQTQNQLRASETLYAEIFNHSAEPFILLKVLPNNEFVYETVNPAYTRLTGIAQQEIVGQTLTQAWPPALAALFTRRCCECLAAGEAINFEDVFDTPRGRRTSYTSLVPLRDSMGQITQIFGSARDITEEKQAIAEQIRLTQYQRLLASLVVKIRQSWSLGEILQTAVDEVQKTLQVERVVFVRLLSDKAGTVTHEAVLPPFGAIRGQDLMINDCLQAVKENYQQGTVPSCADVLNAEFAAASRDLLERYQVRAYITVPILLKQPIQEHDPQASPALADEPTVWGLLVVHQCSGPRAWTGDETDLLMQLAMQLTIALEQAQLQEQETRQRQELGRSNAALEEFAYVASHDLQAPLQTIASYAKLLERRYHNRLDAKAIRYIDYIVSGAQRMQTQIKDLLQYARVSSYKQPFAPTDLNEVLEQAIANLSLLIDQHQASIAVSELPTVMADCSQLVQLFQNLLSNAIKYHSENLPVIRVESTRQANRWIITVSDNGIGIDPKYFERIFQVFQRLHTQEEYSGNGIGLAICKKIVEYHGGEIWVYSSVGQGSRFSIAFPN
ncbi:MAG: PAS domain S-box protein [Cyanophyceae cyanobacterium]